MARLHGMLKMVSTRFPFTTFNWWQHFKLKTRLIARFSLTLFKQRLLECCRILFFLSLTIFSLSLYPILSLCVYYVFIFYFGNLYVTREPYEFHSNRKISTLYFKIQLYSLMHRQPSSQCDRMMLGAKICVLVGYSKSTRKIPWADNDDSHLRKHKRLNLLLANKLWCVNELVVDFVTN